MASDNGEIMSAIEALSGRIGELLSTLDGKMGVIQTQMGSIDAQIDAINQTLANSVQPDTPTPFPVVEATETSNAGDERLDAIIGLLNNPKPAPPVDLSIVVNEVISVGDELSSTKTTVEQILQVVNSLPTSFESQGLA